jgi:hypothetical protein
MYLNIKNFLNRAFKMLSSILCLRKSPDFFIIGAQKSGTTSIFKYISDLATNFKEPERKELYFFTEHYHKGMFYYKSKFPLIFGRKFITGEATPDYLLFPGAPQRIYKHFPKAKIVIILRNPSERAYSQYTFQNNSDKTRAYDPLSFEEAIELEQSGERYHQKDKDSFSYNYKYYSYIARGMYYDQIQRWLLHYPKEQLLVVELGELNDDPKKQVARIFDFIGAENKSLESYEFKPANSSPNKDKKLSTATKQNLNKLYKSENEKLFKLVDKRFDWK